VTQGNLNNNHLYLTEVLDLFPLDVIGGSNRKRVAPRLVRILWGGGSVDTDIVCDKQIFRRRGWVAKFFAKYRIEAGDSVLLERLEPYLYRLSRVDTTVVVPDREKEIPMPPPPVGVACSVCGAGCAEGACPILSRGLGGANWLKDPVLLCAGCYSHLRNDPGRSPARRAGRVRVEEAVSFWFHGAGLTEKG
jgi:hypothetical protein